METNISFSARKFVTGYVKVLQAEPEEKTKVFTWWHQLNSKPTCVLFVFFFFKQPACGLSNWEGVVRLSKKSWLGAMHSTVFHEDWVMNSFIRACKCIWILYEGFSFFPQTVESNVIPAPSYHIWVALKKKREREKKASSAAELIKTCVVASSESLMWNICITIWLLFEQVQAILSSSFFFVRRHSVCNVVQKADLAAAWSGQKGLLSPSFLGFLSGVISLRLHPV